MKQHFSNAHRGFACGLAAAALGTVLLALMLALYDIPRTASVALASWALLLFVIAFSCELLDARGANMLVYTAACAALLLFGGGRVVAGSVFIPASSGFPMLLRAMVFLSGFACAYTVHALPKSDVFVRLGDALIVALCAYLAMCFFLGDALIMPVLAFALLVLCLLLMTAAALRAGGESDRVVRGAGTGGMLILAAVLGAAVLLVSALLGLVSGRINSVVDALLSLWSVIVRIISRAFELFVRFIALFAPKPVQYNMSSPQEDSLALNAQGIEVTAKMPQWAIYLFMGLIAVLILAAVLAVLYMLRGTKLSRKQRKKPRRVMRQSRMLEAIMARLRTIREAIAFELLYRANRRTPQGLYILAVRACRLSRRRKRPKESPGAFIRRLQGELLEHSSLSTLDALADKLDRALYAGESVHLSHGESDAFAAQIQAIRQISLNSKRPAS